ncbi:ATPase [Emiliania huxleyi CCMP1516]|uniref:ATPase n=2 Tax=Emiliania huxleyi TaxID=2903 RepID=A0A0D3KB50_EMIH1|nr:ATPase [Emiliania huxleyi CCMP1516]EOD32985.1 ATPase [Emiliania huxleyi CCMP1516]|eukprot:XP_005785414.1 ATPase [Emiliania huxleyi CCMP1516]
MRPLRGCFRNFSRWRSSGPGGLLASYDAAVARGRIRPDPAQRAAAEALQRLQDGTLADSGGSEAAAGAYIHGPVGGGKSMLMDLFYETSLRGPRRRLHFHELMIDVHKRLHRPLEIVAQQLVEADSLLCLDEMQVTDVADAMILRQLFDLLLARGVTARRCTSAGDGFTMEREPALYERGLNRKYFLPFVALIHTRFSNLALAAAADYRTLRPPNGAPAPLSAEACGAAEEGRLRVARTAPGEAAWFEFAELCEARPGEPARGAPDFLALASAVRTVYLNGVPRLDVRQRNEARRLVLLVDALYEARCALHVAAEAPLAELLSPLLDGGGADTMMAGAEVAVDDAGAASLPFSVAPVGGRYSVDGELASFFTAKDEAFMLRRTLSRLTEMCGPQAEY